MSEQLVQKGLRGVGSAIAGVIFCDFLGLLLFAVPVIGALLGLAMMTIGSGGAAWIALAGHPNRRALAFKIGLGNAAVVVLTAIALVAFVIYALSGMKFG